MFDLNRRPILWAIVAQIQIKVVHSSLSYQQETYQKYNRHGQESPSGYGPLADTAETYIRRQCNPIHYLDDAYLGTLYPSY